RELARAEAHHMAIDRERTQLHRGGQPRQTTADDHYAFFCHERVQGSGFIGMAAVAGECPRYCSFGSNRLRTFGSSLPSFLASSISTANCFSYIRSSTSRAFLGSTPNAKPPRAPMLTAASSNPNTRQARVAQR